MGRPKNPVSRGQLAAQWLREHGGTFADAAAHFNVSRQAVHQQWTVLYPNTDPPGPAEYRAQLEGRITRYRELARTMTRAQMAEAEGITYEAMSSFCAYHGIEAVAYGSYTDEQWAAARRLILDGHRAIAVANATGIKYRTLRNRIAAGELPPTKGARLAGVRSGACAKASAYMDEHNVPLTDAAAAFEVSPPTLFTFRKTRGLPTTNRGRSQ